MVTITAMLPGASPSQMENEVARKIENSAATLQGLKHIYTQSAGRHRRHTPNSAWKAHPGSGGRRPRRGVAHPRRPAGDLRDPVIAKVIWPAPILTYTVASEGHGRRSPSGSLWTTR